MVSVRTLLEFQEVRRTKGWGNASSLGVCQNILFAVKIFLQLHFDHFYLLLSKFVVIGKEEKEFKQINRKSYSLWED